MKNLPYEIKLTYIIAIIVMILFFGFLIFVIVLYNKRQLFFQQQQKLKEAEHQNELLQKELERQKELEKERERISSDMHDDIGARISALKLQGEFIKENFAENPQLKSELNELMKTTEEMTVAMREMIWSLKTQNDFLQNFISFSQKYATEFFAKSKIKLHFTNKITENKSLHAEIRRNLYLCYKEALNNIYKHSKATEVYITFSLENELLKLEISDNGIGLPKEKNQQGNGFYNMQNRMQEISGSMKILEVENGTMLQFISPTEL